MPPSETCLPACTRVAAAATLLVMMVASAAGGSGNYLIITASEYDGSTPLNQFIAAKTAQGFDVMTYMAAAGTSRETIKSYIESLWGTGDAPDYILLVGDAASSTATPTELPYWSGGGSKHAPTDLPYACMGGGDDWHPDIAIGRFPVTSVSMLQTLVDKTLYVEAGNFPDPDYVKRGAFLANPGTQGMAEPTHDWVIENYFEPNDYEGIRLYARDGAGTQDVTDAVNNGCLWAIYYGHSGLSGWWDPSFGQGNVRALSNAGLYGVITSFSCNVGNFTIGECFGETWLREADKGAAAVIFPSSYIYWGSPEAWEPSTVLEHCFYGSFFAKDIWEVGPAWQSALIAFEGDYDGDTDIKRNFFELYNLLGDPSLLLPQPFGFTLAADPPSQDLCCPPDDEAVYTIEVGQTGGFDEAVTLSLSGEPSGATVDFSVNSVPPPFTSVMTIGNLSDAAADQYNLVITGTATSAQRSTGVGLNISNDIPATVTLISPLDGAAGVALMPELTWQASPQAVEYDLEVASDSGFANVVYSATAAQPSHTLDTPLDTLTRYYWHVRAVNACGAGDYSSAFNFITVNMLVPVAYDMLNGETGSYTYFDDNYNGDGDNQAPLAPLSNGVGDLTDNVIATENWNVTWLPYVGWKSIEPTITFHFDHVVPVETVTLHLDDSNGSGGVYPPTDVSIAMGDIVLEFEVDDPSGGEPFSVTFAELGLSGDTLEITLLDDYFSTSRYMMLSEVELYGGSIAGDLNGDACVDQVDLGILLADWGCSGGDCPGDCDLDGDTDQADLGILLAQWGQGCP